MDDTHSAGHESDDDYGNKLNKANRKYNGKLSGAARRKMLKVAGLKDDASKCLKLTSMFKKVPLIQPVELEELEAVDEIKPVSCDHQPSETETPPDSGVQDKTTSPKYEAMEEEQTAERSFSRLKIIKSYLRSTMTNERLSGLALISIERDVAENIDFDSTINRFASRKKRRKRFI